MADIQEQQSQVVTMTINDLIYTQVKDLGKRMDRIEKGLDNTRQELNQRMDRIEKELDRVNARIDKQDAKIEKLADKIDALHNEIKSSTGHISIANITTVGIALAVIYAILSK